MPSVMTRYLDFSDNYLAPQDRTGELEQQRASETHWSVIQDVDGTLENQPFDLRKGQDVWLTPYEVEKLAAYIGPYVPPPVPGYWTHSGSWGDINGQYASATLAVQDFCDGINAAEIAGGYGGVWSIVSFRPNNNGNAGPQDVIGTIKRTKNGVITETDDLPAFYHAS